MTPRSPISRIVSIVLHTALGAAIGYTLSRTLPPEIAIPVSVCLFAGAVIWLIREMRRLRREIRSVKTELERLEGLAVHPRGQ